MTDDYNKERNGGLYFIVGALVLAVAIMGYFYMGSDDDGMGNIEPAAGVERPVNDPATWGNQTDYDATDDNTRQYNDLD